MQRGAVEKSLRDGERQERERIDVSCGPTRCLKKLKMKINKKFSDGLRK